MLNESRLASGEFDVKLTPEAVDADETGGALSRLAIDKRYHGDLEAIGLGMMLSATTTIKESAGYAAMERVTGTLHGRRGSFVLQHTGTLTRGASYLSIAIVPDSGTGELVGIGGACKITIVDGKHFYDLQYTLAGST